MVTTSDSTFQPVSPTVDPISPAHIVLQKLYEKFVELAESKLLTYLVYRLDDRDVDLAFAFKEGHDPVFDHLITSMGLLAETCTKPLIDSIMIWRKSKSEQNVLSIVNSVPNLYYNIKAPEVEALLKSRKSIISNFIICRAITCILNHLNSATLPDGLGVKLENMIFDQLRMADPDNKSVSRSSNLEFFCNMLGALSRIRFMPVCDALFTELTRALTVKENLAELLISTMKHVVLKIYPMDALEESVEVLERLSLNYKNAPSRFRPSFASTIHSLIDPVASKVTAEANFPGWSRAIESLFAKSFKSVEKQRYLSISLPLSTTLLAVSKRDFFLKHVKTMLEQCLIRSKEKQLRSISLFCVERLIWIYLFRHTEATTAPTQKKLSAVLKSLIPPPRKGLPKLFLQSLINIVYMILIRYPEFGFSYVIPLVLGFSQPSTNFQEIIGNDLPLVPHLFATGSADLVTMSSAVDLIGVNLSKTACGDAFVSYDRLVVTLEAFKRFTMHVVSQTKAGAPTQLSSLNIAIEERLNLSAPDFPKEINTSTMIQSVNYSIDESLLKKLGSDAKVIWELLNTVSGKMVFALDINIRPLMEPGKAEISHSKSLSERSIDVPTEYIHLREALASIISSIPIVLPETSKRADLIYLFCRLCFSTHANVSAMAADALKRLAQVPESNAMVWNDDTMTNIRRIQSIILMLIENLLTHGNERFMDMSLLSRTFADNRDLINGAQLVQSLLDLWIAAHDPGSVLETSSEQFLDDIESFALYLTASTSPALRENGITLSSTILSFEQSKLLANSNKHYRMCRIESDFVSYKIIPGRTRFIVIMRDSGKELVLKHTQNSITTLGTHRSDKNATVSKRIGQDVLLKMATSDLNSDSVIWNRCFPEWMTLCASYCSNRTMGSLLKICLGKLQLFNALLHQANDNSTGSRFLGRATPATSIPSEVVSQCQLIATLCCILIDRSSNLDKQTDLSGFKKFVTNFKRQRKEGKPPQELSFNNIDARQLCRIVLSWLSSEHEEIRIVPVTAFGHLNLHAHVALSTELMPLLINESNDIKNRLTYMMSRKSVGVSGSAKSIQFRISDRLSLSLSHLLSNTAFILKKDKVFTNEEFRKSLLRFMQGLFAYLCDPEIQSDWEKQSLRFHYATMIDAVYTQIMSIHEVIKESKELMFPFIFRYNVFHLLEKWCGHGDKILKSRDFSDQLKGSKERIATAQNMDLQRKGVELAALNAMAALCHGPLENSQDKSFILTKLMDWITLIFHNPDERYHSIGQLAIEGLLLYNPQNADLLELLFDEMYGRSKAFTVSKNYFVVFAKVFTQKSGDFVTIPLWSLICLSIFKLGSPRLEERIAASTLLSHIRNQEAQNAFRVTITSASPLIYKSAQLEMSCQLANEFSSLAIDIFCGICKCVEAMDRRQYANEQSVKDMLLYAVPWVHLIDLSLIFEIPVNDCDSMSDAILKNLFALTMVFGEEYFSEISFLWTHLVERNEDLVEESSLQANIRIIAAFLMDLTALKKNLKVFLTANKILFCLFRTKASHYVFLELVSYLSPKFIVSLPHRLGVQSMQQMTQLHFVWDLNYLIARNPGKSNVLKGQVAGLFLANLPLEFPIGVLAPHLAKLLHFITIHLDHYSDLICEQSRRLLSNLLYTYASSNQYSQDLLDLLETTKGPLWNYEDMLVGQVDIESCNQVQEFAEKLVYIFTSIQPHLPDTWASVALNWGTHCSVRHLACRSLQIYRFLSPSLDLNILTEIFYRLASTIADSSPEIQGFSLEIFYTIYDSVDGLTNEALQQFPQLLWCGIACLYSPSDWEVLEGLKILDCILTRLDWQQLDISAKMMTWKPKKWKGKFEGILPLVFKGLSSPKTFEVAYQLISKLAILSQDPFICSTETPLIYYILAQLPLLLHSFDHDCPSYDPNSAAMSLANISRLYGSEQLTVILDHFPKYRKRDDFQKQMITALIKRFFPDMAVSFLMNLVPLISTENDWHQKISFQILKDVTQYLLENHRNMNIPWIDFVGPMLPLLQTSLGSEVCPILNDILRICLPASEKTYRVILAGRNIQALISDVNMGNAHIMDISDEKIKLTQANVLAIAVSCSPHRRISRMKDMESKRSSPIQSSPTEVANLPDDDLISAMDELVAFFSAYPTTRMTRNDSSSEELPNSNMKIAKDIHQELMEAHQNLHEMVDKSLKQQLLRDDRLQLMVRFRVASNVSQSPNWKSIISAAIFNIVPTLQNFNVQFEHLDSDTRSCSLSLQNSNNDSSWLTTVRSLSDAFQKMDPKVVDDVVDGNTMVDFLLVYQTHELSLNMDEIRLYTETVESFTVQDIVSKCTPVYLDVFRLWWHLCQDMNNDSIHGSLVRSQSDWIEFLYPNIPFVMDHLNSHLVTLYQNNPISLLLFIESERAKLGDLIMAIDNGMTTFEKNDWMKVYLCILKLHGDIYQLLQLNENILIEEEERVSALQTKSE